MNWNQKWNRSCRIAGKTMKPHIFFHQGKCVVSGFVGMPKGFQRTASGAILWNKAYLFRENFNNAQN